MIAADVNYSPSRNPWLDKTPQGKNKIAVVWVSQWSYYSMIGRYWSELMQNTGTIQGPFINTNALWWNNDCYNIVHVLITKAAYGCRCTYHLPRIVINLKYFNSWRLQYVSWLKSKIQIAYWLVSWDAISFPFLHYQSLIRISEYLHLWHKVMYIAFILPVHLWFFLPYKLMG